MRAPNPADFEVVPLTPEEHAELDRHRAAMEGNLPGMALVLAPSERRAQAFAAVVKPILERHGFDSSALVWRFVGKDRVLVFKARRTTVCGR